MHAQLNHSRGVYNVLTHALHFKKQQKILMLPKRKVVKLRFFGRTKRKEIIICLHVSNLFDMLKKDVVFKKKYKHILRVT